MSESLRAEPMPLTPESIFEGFKKMDELHRVVDELVFGTLCGAAICYMDLLEGKVVNGMKLVGVNEGSKSKKESPDA